MPPAWIPLSPLSRRSGCGRSRSSTTNLATNSKRWRRRWLRAIESAGLAHRTNGELVLTDAGCFWLHLAQNHFALAYVDTLWTAGRERPWPGTVAL